MYQNFYLLKEKPFSLTPDSELVFPSVQHTAAMEYLRYGIQEKKGFIVITGDVGTGKTTLCRTFLKDHGENLEVALILNSFLTEMELLRSINRDFAIDTSGETREQLINTLNHFLIEQKEKGKTVVVIIDECQNLSAAVLEQIRMLSNLETEKEKLLQIVLLGQPELEETLARPDLRQLNQRITVRYQLKPLNAYETTKYIYYRLHTVSEGEIAVTFTRGALRKIYRACRGNPRNINVLCDYALLTGYSEEVFLIDREIIKKAFKELHWQHRTWLRLASWKRPVTAALAGTAAVGAGLWIALQASTSPETKAPPIFQPDIKIPLAMAPIVAPVADILTFKESGEALWELARFWVGEEALAGADFGQNRQAALNQLGLQQVETWADLPILAKINFPCLLEVKFPQQEEECYVVLSGLRNQEATLLAKGNRTENFSWNELEKIWHGKAVILYRDPDGGDYTEVFLEKMRGAGVELLQKRLYALGYLEGGVSGIYDEGTRQAIQTFQKDMGFTTDGIASVETQMALFHLCRQEGIPYLVQADPPKKTGTVISYEEVNQ